jgi:hypothetical protein
MNAITELVRKMVDEVNAGEYTFYHIIAEIQVEGKKKTSFRLVNITLDRSQPSKLTLENNVLSGLINLPDFVVYEPRYIEIPLERISSIVKNSELIYTNLDEGLVNDLSYRSADLGNHL